MALTWSHALFTVENFDEMVAFYTEVLGFEVTDSGQIGPAQVAFMSQAATDHHQVALVSGKSPDSPASAINHFAFRTETLANVKGWFQQLSADERVTEVRPLTHGNAWSLYFSDPEGNGIEIFCDTPWHVKQPAAEQWDPTSDDDSITATTQQKFEYTPEFKPIEQYYAARKAQLGAQ